MNIVFMGNPQFAVPVLDKLNTSSHDILAAVTNPPKPMGRRKVEHPSQVQLKANELNIPVIHARNLIEPALLNTLVDLSPDIFVVVAFRILPQKLIEIPQSGAINLHASLLPQYRGAAPIQRALMQGDKETGITTFFIRKTVDTGNVLLQEPCPISDDDDYGTLSNKLSMMGAELMVKTCDLVELNSLVPQSQDNSLATPAPKIDKADTVINWNNSAEKIHNQVRGLSPTPGAYTVYNGKRIKVFKSNIVQGESQGDAGTIIHLTSSECYVQTGDGYLNLLNCQREGKSKLNIREFLLGAGLNLGDSFTAV